MTAKKEDLRKKIVGLFFQSDEVQPDKPPTDGATATSTARTAPTLTASPSMAITVNAPGDVNEQIAHTLSNALEKANCEGYDYFEYAKTIEALRATIPSEMALFQTAFATGTVMGVTKKKLLESADIYLKALLAKEQEFKNEVDQRTAETVNRREKELQDIDKIAAAKATEIQKLSTEISALTEKKNTLAKEITEQRQKIEVVKADFATTLSVFTGKIKADREKIDKYIAASVQ
jgi:hypothetical protein